MGSKSVSQLEQELKRAKEKEDQTKWVKGVKTINDFVDKIKHQDICKMGLNRNNEIEYLTIFRINSVTYSKYWGSEKQIPEIRCTAITIGQKYFPSSFKESYSTDTGNTAGDKYHKTKSYDRPSLSYSDAEGFPIGTKKNWKQEYQKIIDTGTLSVDNACFKFGDESWNIIEKGYEEMMKCFDIFTSHLHTIPKNTFDKLQTLYIKQCLESEELIKSLDISKIIRIQ